MTVARRARRPALLVALAFVLTVLTCPPIGFGPAPGFDVSWSGALHMAVDQDLVFGREVIFTYGPLGFLQVAAMWTSTTGVLAILYLLLTRIALAVVLLLALRRSFGRLWAVLGTYVLLQTTSVLAVALAVLLAGMMLLTSDAPEQRRARHGQVFAVVAGVLAGAELLGKFNVGVLVAVTGAVVVLAGPGRRRDAPLFAGGLTLSLVALWLAVGQPLGALPAYGVNAVRVAAGWTDALLFDDPAGKGQLTAGLVLVAVGLGAAWWTGEGRLRDARVPLVLLWAAFAYVEVKSGFVRQDPGHIAGFFGPVAIGLAGFPWRRAGRGAGAVAIGVAAAFAIAALNLSLGQLLGPGDRVDIARHAERIVLHAADRREARAFGRAQIQSADHLSAPVLAAVRGHRVDVWPAEIAVAWAYDLDWRPLPTLQSNVAFTPGLDARNDEALLAADGPDRVLLNGNAYSPADTRLASWDQPRTARSLLCRYRPVASSTTWTALARGPSRCGEERLIGSIRTSYDAAVAVPAPSSPRGVVVARIAGMRPTGIADRIRSLAFKGRYQTLTDQQSRSLRLTPALVGFGLVMRSAPGIDYPAPFGQVPQITAFALHATGLGPDDGAQRLRVDFYERDVGPLSSSSTSRG